MIINLLNDIIAYIEYLKSQNLYITIHDKSNNFAEYMYLISKYNIHDTPFCKAVKSNDSAWNHCIMCQKKIYKKLGSQPFWGMCHAGVEEYVFPILSNEVLGFISVSGYGVKKDEAYLRIKKISKDYIMDFDLLKKIYDQSLIHTKPSLIEIKTLVQPLCHMMAYMFEHIEHMRKASKDIASNNSDLIYSRAITYINRNFANHITLKDISQHCSCSASSISHVFKKRSGHSIREYINHLRMKEAKALLSNSKFPIKDVSAMVGFSDSNYFTNTFKKYFGISPKKFRNQTYI